MRVVIACVVVAVGLGGACQAKPPGLEVLLKSGDRAADGLAMASIDRLVAASPRDVAFMSASTAVFLRRNGAVAVAVRTGDPVLPPFGGTVGEICCAAINDQGAWAFATSVDGGLERSAVILHQGSQPSVLPVDGTVAALALNVHGEVAYRRGQVLYLWRGTGEPLRVATRTDPALDVLGSRPRLGRLLVSGAGTVVFAANDRRSAARGIFTWRPATGAIAVAVTGEPSPLSGYVFWDVDSDSFDVNGAGDVGFVAAIGPPSGGTLFRGVFRYAASTGSSAVVARPGYFVGAEGLLEVDSEYVGVDDAGNVTFEALLPSGRALVRSVDGVSSVLAPIDAAATRFAPTPDSAPRIAWLRGNAIEGYDGVGTTTLVAANDATQGPGSSIDGVTISAGGDATWVTSRSALHRLRAGVPSVVRYEGDDEFSYAFRQGALLVMSTAPAPEAAAEQIPDQQLGIATGDGIAPLVQSGLSTPYGVLGFAPRTLESLVWRGDEVIFEAELHTFPTRTRALVRYDVALGTLVILVREADTVPGGMRIASASPLPVLAGPPMLRATFDGGGGGIFAFENGQLRSVLATGEARPRRRAVKSIADVAVDGDTLFAVAAVGPGGRPDERLLGWTGLHARRARTLAAGGRSAPGGGRLATFDRIFAGHGRAIVESYVERRVRDGEVEQFVAYFLPQRGRLVRLLAHGDPIVGGTALESVADLALGKRSVVGLGTQVGADSLERSLVFQVVDRRVTALAVEGEETPVGGTFPSFEYEGVVLSDTSAVILARPDGTPEASWALLTPTVE